MVGKLRNPAISRGAVALVLSGGTGALAMGLAAGWVSGRAPGWPGRLRRATSRTARSRSPLRQTGRWTEAHRGGYTPTGTAARRLGELDEALASVPRDDPGRASALVARARLFLVEAESPTLALADLERLLSSHPHADEAAEAMYLRASALARAGAQHSAVEAARAFVSHFPRSWRAARAASIAVDILAASGRGSEAEALARDVLARDPLRLERSELPLGERGRYPARVEELILRLGRLYLRSGDRVAAEGAFDLIASPRPGAGDFGETFMVSPLRPEAEVARAEAQLAMGGDRAAIARTKLEALARRYPGGAPGRRARLLLDPAGQSTWEKALALAEAGEFKRSAAVARGAPFPPRAGRAIARLLESRGWLDPEGTLSLAAAIRPDDLDPGGRESICVALARANEALGKADQARSALALYTSERLALVRAEFARRDGDAEGLRAALGSVAEKSELALVLLKRKAGK